MESTPSSSRPALPRALIMLLGGAAVVILVAGLKAAAPILGTFFLALVITIGISPLPARMARKGLPMWLAFLITVLVSVAVIVVLVVLLGGALVRFVNTVPTYADSLNALSDSLTQTVQRFGIDLSQIDVGKFLDLSRIANILGSFASSILGVLSDTSLLLLMIFFMLLDAISFGDKLEAVYRNRTASTTGVLRFAHDTRRYIVITAWTGALVGAVNTVLLMVLGVDFAILWGLLAFLFSFIPNIGFILSMIPPTLLALLQFGWPQALIVAIGFIIINAGVDNVLKPKIIGDDLNLSLATTFLSLVFWGWVLGPIGGILAVPLTLLVKDMFLDPNDEIRWLGQMMSLNAEAVESTDTTTDLPDEYAEET